MPTATSIPPDFMGLSGISGWKRDSGLNHLWLKYPSCANIIMPCHHMNTLPGPILVLALKLMPTDFLANWSQAPLLSTTSKPSPPLSWFVAINSFRLPAHFNLFLMQWPTWSCKNWQSDHVTLLLKRFRCFPISLPKKANSPSGPLPFWPHLVVSSPFSVHSSLLQFLERPGTVPWGPWTCC